MDQLLGLLDGQTPLLIYLVLGAGAAVENLFPPLPADTFVLLGGFLAAQGRANPWIVFIATWGANVASALAVYWAGHRLGRPFFHHGLGRFLLNPTQLRRVGDFYDRWGVPAIFFTRFLPGLRAMIPVFAGVTHQPFLVVVIPVTVASAIWYGALVWLGVTAGGHLGAVGEWVADANRFLLVVAGLVGSAVVLWWLRTRHAPEGEGDSGSGLVDSGSGKADL